MANKASDFVRRILLTYTLIVACWNGRASAQTESCPGLPAQRGFRDSLLSMGPMAGFFLGSGGKLRAGAAFGLQASVGAGLVLVRYNDLNRTGDLFARDASYYFGVPLRATAVPFVRVWQDFKSKVDLSIGPSAQFDSILGWGWGAAALVEVRLGDWWSLDLDWGVEYFPQAEDRLVSSHRVSTNADFDFPPGLQWGLDGGISFRL